MDSRLRQYMDTLFEDAPHTRAAEELKEEILQNITDKYHDLLLEGKTEEDAFRLSVSSIGDISELLASLQPAAQKDSPYPPEILNQDKRRRALLTATAVGLYIVCVVPVIFLPQNLGIVFMFLLLALATGLLIYSEMTRLRPPKEEDTLIADFKAWSHDKDGKKQALHAISCAVWSISVVLYILISFATGAWYITWVIFLIAVSVNCILKAIFALLP